MCKHNWQKIDRGARSEFYLEIRCTGCGARKFIENCETEPKHRGKGTKLKRRAAAQARRQAP